VIIRIWRGRAVEGQEERAREFLRKTVLPLMRTKSGMGDCYIASARPRAPGELLMISFWNDVESLQGFVGADWTQPVILESARPFIRVDEVRVEHWDTVSSGGDDAEPVQT